MPVSMSSLEWEAVVCHQGTLCELNTAHLTQRSLLWSTVGKISPVVQSIYQGKQEKKLDPQQCQFNKYLLTT